MKKLLNVLALLTTFCSLVSCGSKEPTSPTKDNDEITPFNLCILSVNDFHGQVETTSSYPGAAKLATAIKNERAFRGEKNTITLNAGDVYQGAYLSNASQGMVCVECMNAIGFDGGTLGNHEFDWGLDVIKQYSDGDQSNGELNYPVGCANLYYKNTDTRVEWLKDSYVVTKNNVKIGIIPTIAYGIEVDILGTMVADYEFKNPLPIVKDISKRLRNEGCDVIIVNAHDGGINQDYDDEAHNIIDAMAQFPSESRIDVIVSGHTHKKQNSSVQRKSGGKLYYVQAGSYGQNFGRVVLSIDKNKKINFGNVAVVEVPQSTKEDTEVKAIVDKYNDKFEEYSNTSLGTLGEDVYSKSQIYPWVGDCIQKATGRDVCITNEGGIRTIGVNNRFQTGDRFTIKDLYTTYPFDNQLMYCEVKGHVLKQFISQYSDSNIICFKAGLSESKLQEDTYYTVAVIDYLAEKDYLAYFFKNSSYRVGDYILRDVLKNDVMKQQELYGNFKPSRGSALGVK